MHDLLEGLAELGIEDRVDHRVHEAVDVAQPGGQHVGGEARPAVLLELGAHGVHDVAGEEGQPAEQEDTCVFYGEWKVIAKLPRPRPELTQNDGQCFGGLALLLGRRFFAFLFRGLVHLVYRESTDTQG